MDENKVWSIHEYFKRKKIKERKFLDIIENRLCQSLENIKELETCIESNVYRKEEIFENQNENMVSLSYM